MRSEDGFSIIEALVASAILITGVASIAQLFLLSAASTRAAGDATRAAVAAAQKMEELRSTPWSLLADGEDRIGALTRRWSVAAFPADAGGTRAITIEVGRPGSGAAGLITLHMLRTRVAP